MELWEACENGQYGQIIQLLGEPSTVTEDGIIGSIVSGKDVNYKPEFVGTRSALANLLISSNLTEQQRAELTKRFLALGAKIDDNQGLPILGYACMLPNVEAIKSLIAFGANIHSKVHNVPLLHVCVMNGLRTNLRVLLDAGLDVNCTASDGSTALRAALEKLSVQDFEQGDCDDEDVSGSDETLKSTDKVKGNQSGSLSVRNVFQRILLPPMFSKDAMESLSSSSKEASSHANSKPACDDNLEEDNGDTNDDKKSDQLGWAPSSYTDFMEHTSILSDEELENLEDEELKNESRHSIYACAKILIDFGATWVCPRCITIDSIDDGHEHVPTAAITVAGAGGVNALRWLYRYSHMIDAWRRSLCKELKDRRLEAEFDSDKKNHTDGFDNKVVSRRPTQAEYPEVVKKVHTTDFQVVESAQSQRATRIRVRLARMLSQTPPPFALIRDFDRQTGKSIWHIAASHKRYWIMHWLLEQAREELAQELFKGSLHQLEKLISAPQEKNSGPDEVRLEFPEDNVENNHRVRPPWRRILKLAQSNLKAFCSSDPKSILFYELTLCDEEEGVTPLLATSHATEQGGEVFSLMVSPSLRLNYLQAAHQAMSSGGSNGKQLLFARTDVKAMIEDSLWKWASEFWDISEVRSEDLELTSSMAKFLAESTFGLQFLEAKDLVEMVDDTGLNILQRAVYYGADQLLNSIIHYATKGNNKSSLDDDDSGESCACELGSFEKGHFCVLRTLVLHTSPKKRNAIHIAKLMGSSQCLDILMKAVQEHDQRITESFARKSTALPKEEFLLGSKALSQLDENGCSPEDLSMLNEMLIMSIRKGDALSLSRALRAGAHPHYADKEGNYPIPLAASLGNSIILAQLLEMGGSDYADDKDEFGHSAIWLAACLGHASCVNELMKHGADVCELDHETSQSALLAACAKGHLSVVEVIVGGTQLQRSSPRLKAVLEHTDLAGRTPLLTAAALLRPDIVGYLLRAGANPNVIDDDGRDALEHVRIMLLEMEQWSQNKESAAKARIRRRRQRATYLRGIREQDKEQALVSRSDDSSSEDASKLIQANTVLSAPAVSDGDNLAGEEEEEELEWSRGRYREGAVERRNRELAAFFEDQDSSSEDEKDSSVLSLSCPPPLPADVVDEALQAKQKAEKNQTFVEGVGQWIKGKVTKLEGALDKAAELATQSFTSIDDDVDGGLAYFEETKRLAIAAGDEKITQQVISLEEESRKENLDQKKHKKKLDKYMVRAQEVIQLMTKAMGHHT